MRTYSIIIPVFNRPNEIAELLESLTHQTLIPSEVIIVDDGSELKCEDVVKGFESRLPVKYFFKENSGQGFSRNYGFERASGNYFVVFDSDCIIPPEYLQNVELAIAKYRYDLFGGPDRSRKDFTNIQKAINYSMTSFLTTGGIRGRKSNVGKFHPRSFNMGFSKEVFVKVGGYKITRMGEDIEFSIRVIKAGFRSGLIENAFVYHKRRTSFSQFFAQLRFFGRARVNVSRFFPGEVKIFHLFPALFLLVQVFWLMVTPFFDPIFFRAGFMLNLVFSGIVFFESLVLNRNLAVGLLSVGAAYIQLLAYGSGLLTELIKRIFKG